MIDSHAYQFYPRRPPAAEPPAPPRPPGRRRRRPSRRAPRDPPPTTWRTRDIAARCRLTERAVQKIIADLEQGGYLSHTKEGRSNVYRIEPGQLLRHPAEAGLSVAALLSLLAQDEAGRVRRS
jgi:hypothetical protein